MRRAASGFAGLCAGDAVVLLGLRPDFPALIQRCGHLDRWFTAAGVDRPLVQLAGALLWCAAAWLGLGLLAAAASLLPGTSGRVGAAACRALLPGVLRKLLAGSAGLSVLLAPALASARPAPAAPAAALTASATHRGVRHAPLPAPAPPGSVAPSRPAPVWPGDSTPARSPGRAVHIERRQAAPPAARPTTVRVRPGDSLWLLAAARLGRHATDDRIATYWPRWYALNRDVIGGDPSLLAPGEVLRVPAPITRESS